MTVSIVLPERDGGSAQEIATAVEAAQAAQEAAEAASASALSDRDLSEDARDLAQQYAADAAMVSGVNVPIYASVASAQGATIVAGVKAIRTQARAPTYGDEDTLGGGAHYVRVSKADIDAAAYPALAYFRSTDRFMPDGTTDATNGGYWLLNEEVIQGAMFGVRADGVTDDSAALTAAAAFAAALGRPLVMPRGTILVKDVTLPSGTVLRGQGRLLTTLKRQGSLTTGILVFATGASNVVCEDFTLDGNSAADTKSLLSMGAHGSNIVIERVGFKNGCDRWVLRGDPSARFDNLKVRDCVFEDCPIGCVIILAASMSARYSTGVDFIGNTATRCGGNLFSLRDYETGVASGDRWDFWRNCKFNYNVITDCTDTGTDGPIPVEMWAVKGFQQIGNVIDTGTRGLTAGAGAEDAVIAHNLLVGQTDYAMEGGRSRNVKIFSNTAIDCATFYKDTSPSGNTLDRVEIYDNLIIGTGLSAYDGGAPTDTIAFGNDGNTICADISVRGNKFEDQEFARAVVRYAPAAGSNLDLEDNEYLAKTYDSTTNFVGVSAKGLASRRNRIVREADYDSSHHNASGGAVVFGFLGSTNPADTEYLTSEGDGAQMLGALTSGSLYAMGRVESATARYGCRVSGFRLAGAWSSGPIYLADSSGSTRLEGFDIRDLNLSGSLLLNNLNSSLLLGLASGEALMGSGVLVNLGTAKPGGRRRRLHYEGGAATRVVTIRHNKTTGEQTQAIFKVGFVCAQNDGAPLVNEVVVGWGNVSGPTNAPTMYQGGGSTATLTSGLTGGFMEAIITLPTSNNEFMVSVDAEISGRGTVRSFSDFSVRVG